MSVNKVAAPRSVGGNASRLAAIEHPQSIALASNVRDGFAQLALSFVVSSAKSFRD